MSQPPRTPFRRLRLRSAVAAAVVLGSMIATAAPANAAWPWSPKPPAPPAPSCGATVYKASGAAWVCTFADEFNATAVDPTKWLAITSGMNGATAGGACFVNSPNNISEGNGVLTLTTRKEAAPFTCKTPSGSFTTQYSASQIATYGHFYQTYGRFEVRAKFPASTLAGLQSSLWMWPENNTLTGLTGEIDIAEWYSAQADRAIPYLHYTYDNTTISLTNNINVVTNNYCTIADASQFHTYTVTWTASQFKIDFDGTNCLTDNYIPLGTSPFNQPFFVALSQGLGIGKNAYVAGTTQLPAVTQVDYVHAWK